MRDEIRKPSYRDVLDQAPAVLTADILTKASQPSFEGLPLKAQDYLAGLNTAAARGNISYHRCAEDLVGKLSDGRLPAGFDRTDVWARNLQQAHLTVLRSE